ncbi:hypothetical protein ACFX12_046261 [Malus domestica]
MNKAQVILPPPTLSTCSNLTSAHRNSNLRTSHHQLSAFPSNLHLFSYSHAKTLAKPRIFLPHLVASLEQVDETDIMVKPDGVQRGLEPSSFSLKLFQCPQDLAEVQRSSHSLHKKNLRQVEHRKMAFSESGSSMVGHFEQKKNAQQEGEGEEGIMLSCHQYFATLSGFSGGDSPRILDGNRPGMVGKDSGGTSARPGAAHVANRSSESSA